MQGLKITILIGQSLSGETEFFFDSTHDYIVLGCDENMCNITFTEAMRSEGIGNEHLAFKRSLGRYQLDLNTDHYVEIDGKTPFEEQEIKGSHEVTLGKGVILKIEVIDARPKSASVGKPMLQAGVLAHKNRKRYLALVAVITMICIGLIYINRDLIAVRDTVTHFNDSVSASSNKLNSLQKKMHAIELSQIEISQDIIDTISASVYLVLLQDNEGGETPTGTAWVTENQNLATNAHVAEVFFHKKATEKLVVRSSIPPYRTFVVKNSILHPSYKQYEALWQQYLPAQRSSGTLELMETVTPADVALLEVENAEHLGSALPLATPEELQALAPGNKVGYVGYPSERLLPNTLNAPSPVTQQDELVRVTDFFMVKQSSSPNRLIQHGLPITGGASGSPMFNSSGKVIGLICAGNVIMSFGGRMMNSADINFSQSIDYLKDLLEGNEIEASQRYLKQWKKSLKQFHPAREVSLQAIKEHFQTAFRVNSSDIEQELTATLPIPDQATDQLIQDRLEVELPHGGIHLVSVSSQYLFPESVVMTPSIDRNISQYSHPVPYGNFSVYTLILTNNSANVSLDLEFRALDGIPEEVDYTVYIHSWDKPLDEAAQTYAQTWFKAHTLSEEKLSLVKHVKDVALSEESEFSLSQIAGLEMTLDKAGWYVFLIIPQGENLVNAWIMDDQENFLNADNSPNAIALVHHPKFDNTPESITFASLFENIETVQDMLVYFAPFEP